MATPILPQILESASDFSTKERHGRGGTPEYYAWYAMVARCTKPDHPSHKDYGGRGIRVSVKWLAFENFFADMGLRPSSEHTLERKDNNGNYEPSNCRWATHQEQCNNRRNSRYIVLGSERRTVAEWSKITGINIQTIYHRLRRGKSPGECLRRERLSGKRSPSVRDHDRK